ncbi:MAG: rhomboid family intramembrane serine protease [Bacteroidales bacterium]|jgi:membrane associated rhomboid family serine protease|nr:rhomboid family intramembrane serine protease [Bacteroidales bacterium]
MAYYYSGGNGRGGGFLASLPTVTKNLIIINVIIFIATLINQGFMITTFALYYPTSPFFHWWQVITHMFMHGGFWHIFFNMYTLLIFGGVVERIIGSRKFLLFYFICGLGAVALHLGVEYLQMLSYMDGAAQGSTAALQNIEAIKYTPTVGASGAIYGVLMGYAMLFPESRMTLLFPPITLSAKWMVVAFAAIELVTGVTGWASGIAHFAHLGGMLIGWLMILGWRKRGVLFDQNRL